VHRERKIISQFQRTECTHPQKLLFVFHRLLPFDDYVNGYANYTYHQTTRFFPFNKNRPVIIITISRWSNTSVLSKIRHG
jgi:hypothetical protein